MTFEDDELKELLKKRKNKRSNKKIILILLTLSLLIMISFISVKIEKNNVIKKVRIIKKAKKAKKALVITKSQNKPINKNLKFKLKNTLNRVNKRLQEYKQNNVLKLYKPDIKLLSLYKTYAIIKINNKSYLVYNNSKINNYYISRIKQHSINVVYKGVTYRIYKR